MKASRRPHRRKPRTERRRIGTHHLARPRQLWLRIRQSANKQPFGHVPRRPFDRHNRQPAPRAGGKLARPAAQPHRATGRQPEQSPQPWSRVRHGAFLRGKRPDTGVGNSGFGHKEQAQRALARPNPLHF